MKFLNKNASTILTCIGAVGVVATSVMAAKATPKALSLIEEAKEEKGDELSKWETIQVAGSTYVPTVMSGVATVTCIFGSNILNKRTQAALTSAYVLLDQTHRQYKHKLTELYGEDTNALIKTELAKDSYGEERYDEHEYEDDKQLFYDQYSKRYFRATKETVLSAEYEINRMIITNGGASLNDYYDLLDVPKLEHGNHTGWSACQLLETYWNSWLEFQHIHVDMDDGMECTLIEFMDPFVDFRYY